LLNPLGNSWVSNMTLIFPFASYMAVFKHLTEDMVN
jgi:hypothetical protein